MVEGVEAINQSVDIAAAAACGIGVEIVEDEFVLQESVKLYPRPRL
ncbi:MAG: hypothetical protein R2864_10635 [Syntrophotaleaceae bacterium]